MYGEKIKIGVITPSDFFINTAKDIACNLELGVELTTAIANRFEAVPIGQQMETAGVEVVVSRHGTARELQQNISIPVLSVPLTSFQLFQYIQRASQMGRRILVLAYHDHFDGIEQLEQTFNVKITYINRNKKGFEDIENCILYGINQGCQVVMGGKITAITAQKHNLKSLEIPVNPTALAQTLQDACSVAKSRRKEVELNQRYRTVIDTIAEGIIALNRQGNITTLNRVAKSILGLNEDVAGEMHISRFFKNPAILKVMQSGNSMRHQIENIGDEQYLVDHVPVMKGKRVLGGVTTIQKVSSIQVAENEFRRSLTRRLVTKYNIDDFVGQTSVSMQLKNKVKKFALHDTTVLITGDTGTGKEIIAQSIHNLSRRRGGPFVSINCGAIPETLLESELFGYEGGAFTGSLRSGKAGLFELAHHGTIFLDEVGDAPQSVQSRLLRVLQEREVMRIGGNRLIPVDVRVVSATNKNLAQQVAQGAFREDLFYRLNILNLQVPTLLDRIDDLPLLTVKIINRKVRQEWLSPVKLPKACLDQLSSLKWPGNVRQLVNFIDRLLILCEGKFSQEIFDELLSEMIQSSPAEAKQKAEASRQISSLKDKALDSEAGLILAILKEEDFNKKRTAQRLGISRTTLWRKLKVLPQS
jgi:PAS domain S-box-containing protein